MMPIYDKPVWKLMHDMVADLGLERDNVITRNEVLEWFARKYPKIKQGTVSAHLIRLSTNAPSRVHYHARPGTDDLFFQVGKGRYRLYDPETDPPPIYGGQKRLRREGQAAISRWHWVNDVVDQALRERLISLGSPPLDTLVREAGVVLEDRLRKMGGEASTALHGADLVRAVLSPERGILVFSPHPGEQEGMRMLYQGVVQFVRNPTMHKLIDYPENVARLFIQLIDCLLQLLTELEPHHRGEATVHDIRRMLTRISIPKGQQELYEVLYEAGEQGLSADELSAAINRTKSQLAGVLGALGRRINRTEELKGKGGMEIVLAVSATAEGSWQYRMRPVLRKALEAEGIVLSGGE